MADNIKKTVLLEVNLDINNLNAKAANIAADIDLIKKKQKELAEAGKQNSVEFQENASKQRELQAEYRNTTKQIDLVTRANKAQQGSYEQLLTKHQLAQTQLKLLEGTLKKNADGTFDLTDAYKKQAEEVEKAKSAIIKFDQGINDGRSNVGNYTQAIKGAFLQTGAFGGQLGGLQQAFTGVKGGLETAKVGFTSLRGAILATGIGALILLLFELVEAFKANDTLATLFKGVMTGIGVVMDNIHAAVASVIIGIANFIKSSSTLSNIIKEVGLRLINFWLAPFNLVMDLLPAISAVMDGEFKKAAGLAADATVNFGKSVTFTNNELPKFAKSLGEAVQAGIDYEKALDDIEAKQSKLNVKIAEQINLRDELILQSKDAKKTEEERQKLNEQAVEVDKQILKQRLDLLDQEIEAQQKYISALGEDSVKREDAEFRLNDLQVKRLEFQNEAIRFEEIAQNKRNALIEKQAKAEETAFNNRVKNLADEEKLAIHRATLEGATQERIIGIQEQFNFKRIQLFKDYNKTNETEYKEYLLKVEDLEHEYSAFLVAEENKRLEEISNHRDLILAELDKSFKEENNLYKRNFLEQLNLLTDRYRTGAITREQFEKESANLTFSIQQDSLNREIELIQQKLSVEHLTYDQRIDLENQLLSKKAELNKVELDDFIKKEDDKTKKQKEEEAKRLKLISDTENGIQTISSNLLQADQNLNQAKLNEREAYLDKQLKKELAAAGNNAAKKQAIQNKYDKLKQEAEKQSAIKSNEIAKVQAFVNGALGATKTIAQLGFPLAIPFVIAEGAAVLSQIALIQSQSDKLEDGGIIKAGLGRVIGGKPHSQGGTKFFGEDGSVFEAERGELLAVVNKHDTPLLSLLSSVNSIHGRPFFETGGVAFHSSYLADGGFAARANTIPVVDNIQTRNDILSFIGAMPRPVVFVEDIKTGQDRVTKVQSRANV
jgi:hypothetical protein